MKKNSRTRESKARSLQVEDLYKDKKDQLGLQLIGGAKGLKRRITTSDLNRPGLFLAGFDDYFPEERIQLLGRGEMAYLLSRDKKTLEEIAKRLFSSRIPAVIVTGNRKPPAPFLRESDEMKTPLFTSSLEATHLYRLLTEYLMMKLAPSMTIHGTLVDVFGVGLLLTGKSGIGKSECALDLIARGHVLVADDVVKLVHHPPGVLRGSSAIDDPRLAHFIEIRGVGLVDVYSLFGIQAVREDKKVEIHVELVEWSGDLDYERIGLDTRKSDFLGVSIPYLLLPLNPGKNIATILEVISMSYHLRLKGLSAPSLFESTILEKMKEKER